MQTDRGRLYAVYYPAVGAPRGAFVLLSAYAEEHDICRPQLVNFARRLQVEGYTALRFDYYGSGDSEGAFTDTTPRQMESDCESAVDELRRLTSFESVGLVGLRLGGTIAALVAGRRKDIDRVILWEPHVNLWDDLYAQLRATVAMQTVLFKEIRFTREQIVQNALEGLPSASEGYDLNVIYDGFPLGGRFVREAKGIHLLSPLPSLVAPTLIVSVRKDASAPSPSSKKLSDALRAAQCPCELAIAVEPSLPWKHEQTYTTHCPNLYDVTLKWLSKEPNVG